MNSPIQNLAALLSWMGSVFPWIASHAVIIVPAMLVSGAIAFVQLRRLNLDPLKHWLGTGLTALVLSCLVANLWAQPHEDPHGTLPWIESALIWLASQAVIIIPFGLLSFGLTYFLSRRLSADSGKQLLWAILFVVLMPTLSVFLTPTALFDKYDHLITISVSSGAIAALNWLIRRNLPAVTKHLHETTTSDH